MSPPDLILGGGGQAQCCNRLGYTCGLEVDETCKPYLGVHSACQIYSCLQAPPAFKAALMGMNYVTPFKAALMEKTM